jgi:hypothetical protein
LFCCLGAAAAAAAHLKGQTGTNVADDDPRALVKQRSEKKIFFVFKFEHKN